MRAGRHGLRVVIADLQVLDDGHPLVVGQERASIGALLGAAIFVFVAIPKATGKVPAEWWKDSRRLRALARRLATLGKWGRSLAGNPGSPE